MLNRLQDVFASLHSHKVKFVVLGGIAAILHGVPRATFDLDILIEASLENAARLIQALSGAGFGTAAQTTPEDILNHEITVFRDRVRIDVQTSTPGLRFEEAWRQREEMHFRGVLFPVISREDLIASKRASGRQRDLEDIQALLSLPPKGGARDLE